MDLGAEPPYKTLLSTPWGLTLILKDKLDKFRIIFSRCANRCVSLILSIYQVFGYVTRLVIGGILFPSTISHQAITKNDVSIGNNHIHVLFYVKGWITVVKRMSGKSRCGLALNRLEHNVSLTANAQIN